MAGGSASALSLSRPAQASLALRPAGLLSRLKRPLSRGSSPSGCPTEPLVSYRINRQLSGWILPPLMIRAFGAHCQQRTHAPQQISSDHSSSVSARTKNVSGIARPIALAVFRLMANSNFVGCSIGRSRGCAPRKTLCTNMAPSRNKAGPSAPYDIRPPASTKARVLEAAGS
jgi:hypothetical protein